MTKKNKRQVSWSEINRLLDVIQSQIKQSGIRYEMIAFQTRIATYSCVISDYSTFLKTITIAFRKIIFIHFLYFKVQQHYILFQVEIGRAHV